MSPPCSEERGQLFGWEPTFEDALSDPHAQYDLRGELLPHLLAFGPPVPEVRVEFCRCAAVHVGRCTSNAARVLESALLDSQHPDAKGDYTVSDAER